MKYYFLSLLVLLCACSEDDATIKIKGSDTEVNLAVQLAEKFHQINPSIVVSISGGGSGLGIASLLNGTADVANSSRSINKDEMELFTKKGALLDSFIFAQDAIAFVVSTDLPIDSMNVEELTNILSGKYTNWLPITGKSLPINIYGRQSNSGTHSFIKKKLKISFSPYSKQMNGNAQILEAIKADHSGIGYVGAGYVRKGSNKGIKVLPIYGVKNEKSVSPLDAEMIASGKYYFQRPLFQYYLAGSYNKIKPFLDFEKSSQGQAMIQASGYYPAK